MYVVIDRRTHEIVQTKQGPARFRRLQNALGFASVVGPRVIVLPEGSVRRA
jgi:hypothetical protein